MEDKQYGASLQENAREDNKRQQERDPHGRYGSAREQINARGQQMQ